MLTKTTFLALLVAIAVHAPPSHGVADGPDYWQLSSPDAVALRDDRRQDAPELASIPPGATGLKNLGCEGGPSLEQWSRMSNAERQEAREHIWCKVSYEGRTGWIQGKYLREHAAPSSPSFDCAQARGEVETIICGDPELMNLDNMMNAVYTDALNAAAAIDAGAEEAVRLLKAMQRGWIKGRNDCWKALGEKTDCIKFEYRRRISRLQAQWMLVEPRETLRYECGDQAEFFITFFDTELLPSAAVEYGDSREIFVATPTASGVRFEGDFGKYVWLKGEEAAFVWDQYQPPETCRVAAAG